MLLCALTVLIGSTTPLDPATPTGPELRAVMQSRLDPRTFVLTHSRFDVDVDGHVANVHVEQIFENPYAATVEAIYVFPLAHEGAVRAMRLVVGDRILVAQIQDKDEARRNYERAKREGRHTALLESNRPNVFTQSVGRIDPGEKVRVQIDVVQPVRFVDGRFELVLPTVVGPRYAANPGEGVSPPWLPPAYRTGRTIDIAVHVDAGINVARIDSTTHAIRLGRREGARFDVYLRPEDRHPNRDFVLRYAPANVEPKLAQFEHFEDDEGYLNLLFVPPTRGEVQPRSRELVFVIDRSCSMRGEPLNAARAFVRAALDDLRPDDRFTIVDFGERATINNERALPPTPDRIREARIYLDELRAMGGTVMLDGVDAALGRPRDADRLRIAVFLTDGFIGNEHEVLRRIEKHTEQSRVFALGLGANVNRFLLDEMTRVGRGTTRYVLPGASPQVAAKRFAARLKTPVLTDLSLQWSGVEMLDVHPKSLPDLFDQDTVRVTGRFVGTQSGHVILRGRSNGEDFERRVALRLGMESVFRPAVAALWAGEHLKWLESKGRRSGDVRRHHDEIVEVSKRHGVLSSQTAFVAVGPQALHVTDPYRLDVPVDTVGGLTKSRGDRDVSIGAGSPVLMGSLDRGVIRSQINRHRRAVRQIFERALKSDPHLEGRIDLHLVIGGDGRVTRARATARTESLKDVAKALERLAKTWRFPPPKGGGTVVVKYPFHFRPH